MTHIKVNDLTFWLGEDVRREQGWPSHAESAVSSLDSADRILTSLAEMAEALDRAGELARSSRRYSPFPEEFRSAVGEAENAIGDAVEAVYRARKALSFYKHEAASKWTAAESGAQ